MCGPEIRRVFVKSQFCDFSTILQGVSIMSIAKTKSFWGSCCYLLLAFSMSVNAADFDQANSGISIESWLLEGGRELPVLSFDEMPSNEDLTDDIRVENIIQEEGGSVRFQLSHSGPMSRQVFANVRRVEQGDGYTRSIITNIADGHQTEFLTRTTDMVSVSEKDKGSVAGLLAEPGLVDDQYVECPWCAAMGGYLLSEMICTLQSNYFFTQCRATCEYLGGVRSIDTGICGVIYAECICWIQPKRDASEF